VSGSLSLTRLKGYASNCTNTAPRISTTTAHSSQFPECTVVVSFWPGGIERACLGKGCESFHNQLTSSTGLDIFAIILHVIICTVWPLNVLGTISDR
jgi:hypothetical protein